MNKPNDQSRRADLPKAKLKKDRWFTPIWLAPLLALSFVGWLLYRDIIQTGPTITIRFKQGQGIEVGKTMLQYRSVKVGKVSSIELSEDQKWVQVKVSLDKSAEGIARKGSQFWVVHPEVTAAEIRGLRTIVSGDFIQVNPGQGPRQTEFVGLEEQPVLTTDESGGLSVVLLTTQLKAVEGGSPILYRGMKVGQVVKYRLGHKAQTIEIFAHIKREFAPLVRKNSKFWNAGGVNMDISLFGGADISAQSFKTLVGGGVAFATPNQLDEPASNEMVFRLYDKPEDQWLNWSPEIEVETNHTEGGQEDSNNAGSGY